MKSALKNTELGELWNSMSPEELEELLDFLRASGHPRRGEAASLANVLLHFSAGIEEVSRETIYKELFPGEAYQDSRLRHYYSYLSKLISAFLVQKQLEAEPFRRQSLLIRALETRQTEKPFRLAMRRGRKMLEKETRQDAEWYQFAFELRRTEYAYVSKREENLQESLQELSHDLDRVFVLEKLKQACAQANHERIFEVKYDPGLLPVVREHLPESMLLSEPVIALFYACLRMLREPETDSHFTRLKDGIRSHAALLGPEDQRFLYLAAVNHCIRKLNEGEQNFLREVFGLYQIGLEQEILLDEKGQLSPASYKNITVAGIRLEEFTWVREFISDWQAKLPEEEQADFRDFCLARLSMAEGEFREAARLLNRLYFRDLFTLLDARVMLLKAWFEVGETALIEHQLDNFQRLLARKEVLAYHRKNYRNFARLLRQLLRLNPWEEKSRLKFAKKMEEAEPLTERNWFREKLENSKN